MISKWIKNFDNLVTTENRRLILEIAEAGLEAINTKDVVASSIKLENNILFIKNKNFNLKKFKKIKLVGFGKASCEAASALEAIFGSKINEGAVVDLNKTTCIYIEMLTGTHPRPSEMNVVAGERIYEIIKDSNEYDLIIVLVSGGGSALLCYPESEFRQGIKLYDSFLKSGKTITEINTVRKHLSLFKGGGLAKIAFPATIIGLVFSDIPGDAFENVASGPTYKDKTTIADANKIISTILYDEVDNALEKIFSTKKENSIILAAGDPRIAVPKNGGKGGRNLHMGLSVIKRKLIDKEDFQNSVFISFASDGMDNSDVAGAIVDKNTIEKAEKLSLDVDDYLNRFDSYNFFKKTGDTIITGFTGANVSDLMILLTKND